MAQGPAVKKARRKPPSAGAAKSGNAIAFAVGAAIAEDVKHPSAKLRHLMKVASAG